MTKGKMLSDLEADTTPIILASGSVIEGELKGTLDLGSIKIKNCLFSPRLSTNLLSVSDLTEEGLTCVFKKDGWFASFELRFELKRVRDNA